MKALVAEALDGHCYSYPDTFCECGKTLLHPWEDYREHLADVLASAPLAVIDPEDRKQVERLLTAYYGVQPSEYRVEKMQAALRVDADPKPPKPAEPTGRYAVVVDDEGREWLRTEWDDGFNKPWQCEATHAHWQAVNAVRVRSEGVTA